MVDKTNQKAVFFYIKLLVSAGFSFFNRSALAFDSTEVPILQEEWTPKK